MSWVGVSPPVTSRSSTAGSEPLACSVPAVFTKDRACAAAEPAVLLGRAKWYAPWISPALPLADQSPAKYGLRYAGPSVALTNTNDWPLALTDVQLMACPLGCC